MMMKVAVHNINNNIEQDELDAGRLQEFYDIEVELGKNCLLYTSPSPRDGLLSRMPSSA